MIYGTYYNYGHSTGFDEWWDEDGNYWSEPVYYEWVEAAYNNWCRAKKNGQLLYIYISANLNDHPREAVIHTTSATVYIYQDARDYYDW